jgi:hypothetical protein
VAATTETPGRSEPGLSGMWDRPLEALEAMKLRRVACGSYYWAVLQEQTGPEWYVGPATRSPRGNETPPSGMWQLPLRLPAGANGALSGMWDLPLEALEAMKLRRVACGSYYWAVL